MKLRLVQLLLFFITACNNQKSEQKNESLSHNEWALVPFAKVDSVNPIIKPDSSLVFNSPILNSPVKWAEKDVFNPAAIVRNDTIFLLYRAQDRVGKNAGTSRIGLAWSRDGLHFNKYPEPVLYPADDAYKKVEWEGGCEDPRIVQDADGTYYLTYTAYDGDKARLMVASSKDLYHWMKHGPVFAKAFDGKYMNKWTKAGSIVSMYENGNATAVKINGKYWMYWGDKNVLAATSDDLVNWEPVLYNEDEKPEIELRYSSTVIFRMVS